MHLLKVQDMPRQKRILLVRQDRIGDVVLSTHIPRAIKKYWKNSYVAVLVSKYSKDVYLYNPYVDKIIIYDDIHPKGLKNFLIKLKEIRRYKFNHALMLLPSERINYMLFFAGIFRRVGVGQKFFQFITFTKEVSRHKYIPLRHEADYCMDLARAIGIQSNDLKPEIFLSESERLRVKKIRTKAKEENKYLIGLNTTSKNSSPNLSMDSYIKLIKQLQRIPNLQIILTDYQIDDELKNLDGVEYPDIGKPLRNTIVDIAALDCLISSSTGPMHIAAALGIFTISIFCTLSACSWERWGPLGNKHEIILPDENFCGIECPGDPKACTLSYNRGIGTEKILSIIQTFLQEKELRTNSHNLKKDIIRHRPKYYRLIDSMTSF